VNIYVGNLSYASTKEDVEDLFEQFGEVSNVKLITDRETGRAKGFGFITMNNDSEANNAMEKLNGSEFAGRSLVVNKAKDLGVLRERTSYSRSY
jgi:RNA recognition motif-containing protein